MDRPSSLGSPSVDWKEIIAPGESLEFERYAEQLRALQRRDSDHGRAGRGLHGKGAGVLGEFTVLPQLPEAARVGLFAQPATYRAYVRFSNGARRAQHDKTGDVRGIALKLLGVEGKKIIPGMEKATTQDFLLIRSSTTPFRDAKEFVWFVRAAATPALLLPKVIAHFGPLKGFGFLSKLVKQVSAPFSSVATSRYFSALPIKFGRYAVRLALDPHAQADPAAKAGEASDYLTQELAQRLAKGPVVYDFRVQFFTDEARTPIEDSSRDWNEADAPFVTVARLTLPQQDTHSPRGQRVAEYVDQLSFDPWHAGEDFRPLGNMMRARNAAYRLSTQERHAAAEPEGSDYAVA